MTAAERTTTIAILGAEQPEGVDHLLAMPSLREEDEGGGFLRPALAPAEEGKV